MVPIRFVSEALGQNVSFNSAKQTVVIRNKSSIIAAKASLLAKLVELPKVEYDKDEVERIMSRLARFEEIILQKLVDSGDTIKLVNGPITDIPEYENLKGVIPRGWEGTGISWDQIPGIGGFPVVIRIGYSEPSYEHGHSSINLELHETSHAIDSYVFDNVSQKQEFEKVWKKEVVQVFGDDAYFTNYPEEYYAETFAMYHLSDESGQKLKKLGPLTYQFIQTLIENLK
jgi:Pro-Pro endopeptidase